MSDEPLRVCMFSNLYPPVVSGSATQSSSLARELVRRGHAVCIITARVNPDTAAEETVDGVQIYRLPALRLPKLPLTLNFPWLSYTFTPQNQRRIARIIERHQPEIFHLHNHMFDLGLSAVRMKKHFKKTLVVTIHTVIKHANPFYNIFLYPGDRLFLKRAVIWQAEAVLCPDINIVDYVNEAFKHPNAVLLPYGISLPEMPGNDRIAQIKAQYGLDGKRVILSLGHVHEIRNRKDMVEALPGVLERFPNAVLLVAGAVATDTPARLARQLGVQEAVIFTGPIPHADVPAFLALADVEGHWLNQEAPEKTSLGIASLEAMSAGKPILSAANPDTYGRGVLRPNENFVLVEPGKPRELAQTIVDLLSNEERRRMIGEQARQTVLANFSWDSVCARTIEVYRRTKL